MATFTSTQFLEDVKETCGAINAPCSEKKTLEILAAYEQNFVEGAVLWRTTDRPGDALNYRFYVRRPVEVLDIAIKKGLLEPKNSQATLLQSWSKSWGKSLHVVPEQSCDFDAKKGLTKAWAYMGGLRPLDDILSVDGVPASIIQHKGNFDALKLNYIRHVAVALHSNTVNLYLRTGRTDSEALSESQATTMVSLAGHTSLPLKKSLLTDMQNLLSSDGFTFAVTVDVGTGDIKRVAFYALGLPPLTFPRDMDGRLSVFFDKAPSRDDELFTAVAWSFGKGDESYVKAEKSYCGNVVLLLKEWKTTLTNKAE